MIGVQQYEAKPAVLLRKKFSPTVRLGEKGENFVLYGTYNSYACHNKMKVACQQTRTQIPNHLQTATLTRAVHNYVTIITDKINVD